MSWSFCRRRSLVNGFSRYEVRIIMTLKLIKYAKRQRQSCKFAELSWRARLSIFRSYPAQLSVSERGPSSACSAELAYWAGSAGTEPDIKNIPSINSRNFWAAQAQLSSTKILKINTSGQIISDIMIDNLKNNFYIRNWAFLSAHSRQQVSRSPRYASLII